MTTMTSAEQLVLELMNRARMDPNGEVARMNQLHPGTNFTLNEGLAAGTISSTPKQVLAGTNILDTVADNHNTAMLTDIIPNTNAHVLDYINRNLNPHTQAGDGAENTRIQNAGYTETIPAGHFFHDENIDWQGTTGTIDLASMTTKLENDLFWDTFDSSRGHRLAIMDDTAKEAGVGITTGVVQWVDQNNNPMPLNAVVGTVDFGISGTNSFLTGAVYNDTNGNFFYDLNEGVANITAKVTTTTGTLVGSDITGSGGGWSVSEPGGTYNVTFTGGTLPAAGVSATVAGGNSNAKVDLVNGNAIFSNVTTTLGANAKDLHLIGIDSVNATGNDLDNTIYGNNGSNTIDGGAGFDTVVYTGTKASYGIAQNADGSITITGPDGTDTLKSIEKVQFSDGTYTPPATAVAGSVSIGDASIVEGNSGQQLLNFTVTRSGGTAAFSVNFGTVDGTGANGATTADNDYVANSGTVSFGANETSKVVQIAINGDTKVEGNESFNVVLSSATNGATISKATGIGTIVNDDSAPVAGSVSIGDASIVEGNSGQQLLNFTVTRSGGTAAFSVNFGTVDGTGANGATTADNDYVANSGTVSFGANETSKVIQIAINGDTKVEGNESFNVVLSSATNGATISKATGIGTIINDDSAPVAGSVSIGDASIVEGNSGQQFLNFTVTRSGGTAAFSVNFGTVDGTGANGATTADNDYVANSGTVSFGANETSKVIQIAINGDTKVEGNESFNVVLSNATNGATISKATGIGTIINDDTASNHAPVVTVHDVSVAANASIAASSMFVAHDADGDNTITQYGFYDAGSGGGHFAVNGVTQADNGWFYVAANNLGSVSYVGGAASGSETLYVAAYDGQVWSDYPPLTANTTGAADDYSNTSSTTGLVSVGGTATGNLEVLGDHDWFKVTLTAGHNYLINEQGASSNGGTLVDPYLRLVDANNSEYAYNDDGGVGRDAQLAVHVTNTGIYYIDAAAYNDATNGTYTISVQDVGTSSFRFESPTLGIAAFGAGGSGGGWTSNDQFPREMADVNGDGLADIIGFGNAGPYVSLATGGGHFASPFLAINAFGAAGSGGGWSSDDHFPREMADVNGDGMADIIGFGNAGAYVSLATGGGHFAASFLSINAFGAAGSGGGWSSDDQFPREMADVNGDGMADIVGFGNAGAYVSLATGGGHFAAPFLAINAFGAAGSGGGWSSDDQFPREMADVNGDGMSDIIGFGNAGAYVSLATGGGHFAAPFLAINAFGAAGSGGGWTSNDQFPREMADVNGDGMSDIVGFGNAGPYVSLATGGGHFAAPVLSLNSFGAAGGGGGWWSEDQYPRMLADVTGDHKADIIGFGLAGAYVSASHDFLVV